MTTFPGYDCLPAAGRGPSCSLLLWANRSPLLACALLVLLAAPVSGQEPDSERDRVDQIMARFSGTETPGALVAVVRNGELAFERGYGMADLTHGVPLTLGTRTNIGSTSKQFTAFAIGLLAERGQLSLDDDVRLHLPELPDLGETVTLRHLISHTSGYREFLNALAIGGWRLEYGDHIARDEILAVVQRQPELQNSPGAEWNYNNTGYALLAIVVERVTGETFQDWMRSEVFEPLGMHATLVRENPRQIVPNSARGYLAQGDDEGFQEATDIWGAMGAGGIYTTLGDLVIWMRNLRSGELGGADLAERMQTRNVLTTGDTTTYAMGLMVTRNRGLTVVQHGGADAAHRSTFIYYPELNGGLIVQSNHSAFDSAIPGRIAEVFFGEHMEPREEPDTATATSDFDPAAYDSAAFDIFIGRYELEVQPGFILAFRREDDRLLTQATGQSVIEIRPTSDSTFVLSGVPASLTFHRDEQGGVTGLTLHQNGDHAARRLPDEDLVTRDLSPYEGRYYSAEFETFYTVEVEEGHLVLRHRRRPPVTLNHVRDDEFAGSFPVVRVDFEQGADGAVTAFRASNVRARDIRFERMP